MTKKLRVGILGAGVFGTYHARKVAGSDLAELAGIFDADSARADAIANENQTHALRSVSALFDGCEAVMIATPARTHFELVGAALEAGKHVLVEKPLALRAEQADQLVYQAQSGGLILQVGHQERLVCRALSLFDRKMPIEHLELIRCGPPPKGGRAMDVSVIWDLMIHDLDLAHCLLGELAQVKTVGGICELGDELDEVEAEIEIGHVPIRLKASRIADAVERRIRLHLSDGLIEVDFVNRTMTNTTGFPLNETFASDIPDPLGAADEAFFAACSGHTETPISGLTAAFAVATAEKLETLARPNTGNV